MKPDKLSQPCKVCGSLHLGLRWRALRDHSIQYLGQCQACGASTLAIGKAAALAFAQGNNIPQFSEALREDGREASRVASDERYEPLHRRLSERPGFLPSYSEYLASDRWHQLRRKVFQRANGQCEGCLEAPATQVHHLSYKHIGAEFLWELVAICDACHTRCHEQGQYNAMARL